MKLGDPELFKTNEIIKEIRSKSIALQKKGYKDIVALYTVLQETILEIENELKEFHTSNQEGT